MTPPLNPNSPALFRAALALDPLGDDLRAAMDLAAGAGFSGVAVGARHPTLAPANLGPTGRRHLRRTLASRGLQLTCLRSGARAGGIFDPATADRCVTEALAAIQLAGDLKAPTVSVYLGDPGPGAPPPETWRRAVDALAEQADRVGIQLALSSSAVAPLARILAVINAPWVQANLDTLRLLGAGDNLESALPTLAGRIGLWTCADAVRSGNALRPVELGCGQAQPEKILSALREIDFHGPIVADVRDLSNPAAAATRAATFLRTELSRYTTGT
jgi:sugar phosphate isomerase/epimerase